MDCSLGSAAWNGCLWLLHGLFSLHLLFLLQWNPRWCLRCRVASLTRGSPRERCKTSWWDGKCGFKEAPWNAFFFLFLLLLSSREKSITWILYREESKEQHSSNLPLSILFLSCWSLPSCNNIYLQQHPLTLTPTPTPTTIMFNTWKYDAETDQVQSVRNGFDPVTARSSSHQACDRCHEKKVSQHPPSTCTSLPLYESYTNISTAQVQWR